MKKSTIAEIIACFAYGGATHFMGFGLTDPIVWVGVLFAVVMAQIAKLKAAK